MLYKFLPKTGLFWSRVFSSNENIFGFIFLRQSMSKFFESHKGHALFVSFLKDFHDHQCCLTANLISLMISTISQFQVNTLPFLCTTRTWVYLAMSRIIHSSNSIVRGFHSHLILSHIFVAGLYRLV